MSLVWRFYLTWIRLFLAIWLSLLSSCDKKGVKIPFWTNTTHFTLFGSIFIRVWPENNPLLLKDLAKFHQSILVIRPLPLQLAMGEKEKLNKRSVSPLLTLYTKTIYKNFHALYTKFYQIATGKAENGKNLLNDWNFSNFITICITLLRKCSITLIWVGFLGVFFEVRAEGMGG